MISVFRVTILCTHASPDDSAGATLRFTYFPGDATHFWSEYRRFMNTSQFDSSYCFAPPSPSSLGTCKSSLLNKSFSMESSVDFNGGFSADVYVTLCLYKSFIMKITHTHIYFLLIVFVLGLGTCKAQFFKYATIYSSGVLIQV